MDIRKKLRIEGFERVGLRNFPAGMCAGFEGLDLEKAMAEGQPQALLFYIDRLEDVAAAVEQAKGLPTENRLVLVFRKGRKDGVNRDGVIGPFREGGIAGFSLKAPQFCALDEALSAFVLARE